MNLIPSPLPASVGPWPVEKGHKGRLQLLAFYERMAHLIEAMPSWEKAAWSAWEDKHLDGRTVGSSDWPGLDKYRAFLTAPPELNPRRKNTVPPKVRLAIFERDGHECKACGKDTQLSIDHITPVSRGGSDEQGNLQTLCRPCNSRKGARVSP